MTLILPPLSWISSPNFSSRGGQKVRLCVVHDCEGNYAGSVSWFAQARSQVSAHIVLDADGSRATQMVAFANKAWHVCFGGNERYVTRSGMKSFSETVGTVQDVLTPSGFAPLEIRSFGFQRLNRVTFSNASKIAH